MSMDNLKRSRVFIAFLFLVAHLTINTPNAMSGDWPQFLGPTRNGISAESGWTSNWGEGPPILWEVSVGTGFSPVCVVGKRLYTMGFDQGKESILCLEADTGKELWRFSYPAKPYAFQHEGGPCGSPVIDGNFVYTLGKDGQLICLSSMDGSLRWRKNIPEDFGVTVHELGFTGSPLVEGDHVIVDVGTVMAFRKSDGGLVWRSQDYPMAFASVISFDFNSNRLGATMNHIGLLIFDLKDGSQVALHPLATFDGVNVASPIISGASIFVSAGYDQGSELLELTNSRALKTHWKNRNMRNHFNNSLLWKNHLYGFDGNVNRQGEGELRCLEWQTGDVEWSEPSVSKGSLIIAGGKILALTGAGELVCAEAAPEGFHELARTQVLGGKCWTPPALADGLVYCRNSEGSVVCVDLRGRGKTSEPD